MRRKIIIVIATFTIITTGCANKKTINDNGESNSIEDNEYIITERNSPSIDILRINNKPTVIDFSASWCGPCRQLSPFFDNWERQFGDKINFIKVDIDENPELANQFGINAVPTILFIESGKYEDMEIQPKDVKNIIMGFQPKEIEIEIHHLINE